MFPSTRYPSVDAGYQNDLRRRLSLVLDGQAAPDERTGSLIAVLAAASKLSVVPVTAGGRLGAIAKKVGDGEWAADSSVPRCRR